MGTKKTFNFLVEGGKATGGPPIGPALGPLGVNIMQVVNRINELTKEFSGMRVPVTVTVDIDTKEFEVSVGVPTTTALIIRELKVEKGSGLPHEKKIGNLSIEQIVKIALIKRKQLLAKNLKGAVKEVLGTCLSMGVTVEGKDPRVVQKEIDAGKYDEILLKYEEGEG
ncbi:MAG: 50S ribosomal protein L11 [archaeon GB-1867-005]|nr:50S ribosomal protein L11 [Candidatus Culexmicrobium cathedralense]